MAVRIDPIDFSCILYFNTMHEHVLVERKDFESLALFQKYNHNMPFSAVIPHSEQAVKIHLITACIGAAKAFYTRPVEI